MRKIIYKIISLTGFTLFISMVLTTMINQYGLIDWFLFQKLSAETNALLGTIIAFITAIFIVLENNLEKTDSEKGKGEIKCI